MKTSVHPIEVSADTVEDIRRLVSSELEAFGVGEGDVLVSPGEDHDGDPAIMVQVKYRRPIPGFDGRAAARAAFRLNDMLTARGESRFAYITHADA